MSPNERLEDLRRRVHKDPASIAFAQLAEELRRAGQHQESVDVCRAGLATHPVYLSARVTLGRALIDLNRLDEARKELEQVREIAPENLAAIRALGEIHQRLPESAHSDDELDTASSVTAATPLVEAPPVEPAPAVREEPLARQAESARALRTITALEQWLAAIHVARAHRNA